MTDEQIQDLINEFSSCDRTRDQLWYVTFKYLDDYAFPILDSGLCKDLIRRLWKRKLFNVIFEKRMESYE